MRIQTVEQLIEALSHYDPANLVCCTSTLSDGTDYNYTIDEVDYDSNEQGSIVILVIQPDK